MEKIFNGTAPFGDNSELVTLKEPRQSFPNPMAPERPEEFAPGLDPDLQELADAFTAFKESTKKGTTNGKKSKL